MAAWRKLEPEPGLDVLGRKWPKHLVADGTLHLGAGTCPQACAARHL